MKDMLLRMGAYIDHQERVVCGEWCGDTWPDCSSEVHAEGRAILALIGGEPGDGDAPGLALPPETEAAPGA